MAELKFGEEIEMDKEVTGCWSLVMAGICAIPSPIKLLYGKHISILSVR
jgi:hypothetical protein